MAAPAAHPTDPPKDSPEAPAEEGEPSLVVAPVGASLCAGAEAAEATADARAEAGSQIVVAEATRSEAAGGADVSWSALAATVAAVTPPVPGAAVPAKEPPATEKAEGEQICIN
eukprot:13260530-Alexandrium_andersonii.AAC.1